MRLITDTDNFNLIDASVYEPEWLDDDWRDRKDALDCETVRFDETIEIGLCEAMWEADLVSSGLYEPAQWDELEAEFNGKFDWEDEE